MNHQLPQGWASAPLATIAKARMGETILAKQLTPTGVPVYSAGQENEPWGFLDKPRKPLGKSTVVVSARGSIGFPKIPKAELFASTQTTIALRFPDEALAAYTCLWLKAVDWGKLTKGGAIPMLTVGDINELAVPLAPLDEQRRIVAKLEALLGKADACQERLAKIPVLLKRFRQSVLAAACSGRLTADWREEHECEEDADALLKRMATERRARFAADSGLRKYREAEPVLDQNLPPVPESWRWTNFDHCAWEITVGHVGPMKDRYVEKGVAFLRCQNVRPLRFDTDGLVRIPADFHAQLSKSALLGGEILVVRSGANTGDCCVFPRNVGQANCADLVVTRPLSGLCPEYGALYVSSPSGHALLQLNETGIAQPHFNVGAMRVKAFPLPPLAEQAEIVRRVGALFALADQIEARFTHARAQVDQLAPSLLARAFAGKLVPQDPTDEPASALLERIRLTRG